MNHLGLKRARRARESRARDTDDCSVTSTSTLDDESQHRPHRYTEGSGAVNHIRYDAGSYEGFEEHREHDELRPEQTANGTNFADIQVPDGAPTHLVCEECERRCAVGCCEDCNEVFCGRCLAIAHIPSANGQAHTHLAQGGIRTLRAGDESTVRLTNDDPISVHQIDEEEMATRRDLSVPSSLDAPTIGLTSSKCAPRNAAVPLHTKGQLVVFDASLADSLPEHFADGSDDDGKRNDDDHYSSYQHQASRPQELYGEVLSVPMARHGEWGHARRRAQGYHLFVRVKLLAKACGSYSEPFVGEWLSRKHQQDAPREPVEIVGGGGADPLAREVGAAKAKDRQREAIQKTLTLPKTELPMTLIDESSAACKRGDNGQTRSNDGGIGMISTGQPPRVVLVAEHELFTVEQKREGLKMKRFAILGACLKGAERRGRVVVLARGLRGWHNAVVKIRNARWEWASQVLQRRTRGALVRMRLEAQHNTEERMMREAGRRLHRQFRYLDNEEVRKNPGRCVTTDGRVFLSTKAELGRLEALRRVMAERSCRMLSKGVHGVKVSAFAHWRRYTDWERKNSETYVFSVARDASLSGDEPVEQGSYKTEWRHPSHGITLPPLPQVHMGRAKAVHDQQTSVAAATAERKMAGPTPFCSWLVAGSVLISSYLHVEARARPRDFKQPQLPDSASQILLAGVGTLVCLAEEEEVRRHEVDLDFPSFDRAFSVRHKTIAVSIKSRLAEAKHAVQMLRQEESNVELLRSLQGYDQEERRRALADVVGRMRSARTAYSTARRTVDLFPKDLGMVWDPLPEDDAPLVDDVVKLVARLEGRLRAGQKLCIWSPRGHGRVGLVGAVLLGRLYGCTPEDSLLRIQVCHDARENLKGQPQISCPQTIAQVQCVREALLQMSSMYTHLTMRSDLPASTKGVKVCRSVRGVGPTVLSNSVAVPEETQSERYKRELEDGRQRETIQYDHQSILMDTARAASLAPVAPSLGHCDPFRIRVVVEESECQPFSSRFEYARPTSSIRPGLEHQQNKQQRFVVNGAEYNDRVGVANSTTVPPNTDLCRGSCDGGVGGGSSGSSPSFRLGEVAYRPGGGRNRARAVAAVPYPTMRSLRLA